MLYIIFTDGKSKSLKSILLFAYLDVKINANVQIAIILINKYLESL